MASVVELAKLSNAVYDDTPKIGPWIRFGLPFQQAGSGFKGALYQHAAAGEYALVIAGTKLTDADDLLSDYQLAMGRMPDQYRVARSAYSQATLVATEFGAMYLTGHSLGGGLASMLAKEHGDPVVTFNAPGMARAFAHLESNEPGLSSTRDEDRKVLHICAFFDIVSRATGKHMGVTGSVRRISTPVFGSDTVGSGLAAGLVTGSTLVGAAAAVALVPLTAHSISRLIPALEARPEYTQDLEWV